MNREQVNERMVSLKDRFEFGAYCECCDAFSAETAEWDGLDSRQHYTMLEDGSWAETSDNAHGGPSVAWAFGVTFKSTDELNWACESHYDAWLEENYNALMAEVDED